MSFNRLVEASLRTDPGRIRDHNEDYVTLREPSSREDESLNGWLYILADGVGGADAGEIASELASQRTIAHYLELSDAEDWSHRLSEAMRGANSDLRQYVADRGDNSRMATTMVAVAIRGQEAYIANVGDSRAYHWRQGEFSQITKDQSLVAKLLEEGAITEAEAAVHPRKNVILYSLGSDNDPRIDCFQRSLESGDILLLCSDGLTRHVSDEELATLIAEQEPARATESLIQLANNRGGEDNISAAVLHYNSKTVQTQVISEPTTTEQQARGRMLLWMYTIFLSLVQTLLMLLAWFLLHV